MLAARAKSRQRDLGVRMALGGSGWRLARLLLVEAGVLAAGGIALGVALAAGFERLIHAQEPRMFAEVAGAGLFGRALAFACVAATAAALLCSIAPLLVARSTDVRVLIDGGAGDRATARRSWAGAAGMAIQAALAASVATLLPARRAGRVDPAVTLRAE